MNRTKSYSVVQARLLICPRLFPFLHSNNQSRTKSCLFNCFIISKNSPIYLILNTSISVTIFSLLRKWSPHKQTELPSNPFSPIIVKMIFLSSNTVLSLNTAHFTLSCNYLNSLLEYKFQECKNFYLAYFRICSIKHGVWHIGILYVC